MKLKELLCFFWPGHETEWTREDTTSCRMIAICVHCGLKNLKRYGVYEMADHDWYPWASSVGCQQVRTCRRCNIQETKDHNWETDDGWGGTYTRTCNICGRAEEYKDYSTHLAVAQAYNPLFSGDLPPGEYNSWYVTRPGSTPQQDAPSVNETT